MSTKEKTGQFERCNNCEMKVAKADLKQCSGCRIVKYCSKECQRAHWGMHKRSCGVASSTRQELAETQPEVDDEVTAIGKWLTYWRPTLFEYGLNAMDLANNPHNKLATHIVFIEFTFKEPRERHRLLQVHAAMVIPRRRFVDMMLEQGIAQSYIDNWAADNRGPNTLQITFVVEGHVRTLWVGIGNLEHLRGEDKTASRLRAQNWVATLSEKLQRGKPSTNS